MTETIIEPLKKPGIVIFAAVLNFIGALIGVIIFGLGALILLFGNVLNLAGRVQNAVTEYSSSMAVDLPAAAILNFISISMILLGAAVAAFSIFFGLAELKGKKWAWYAQIISSILSICGILFGPLGAFSAITNLIILILFFQRPTRAFFKI